MQKKKLLKQFLNKSIGSIGEVIKGVDKASITVQFRSECERPATAADGAPSNPHLYSLYHCLVIFAYSVSLNYLIEIRYTMQEKDNGICVEKL